jgi:LuxR family transcriptional regulator, maltose regulon positive regulatory protein
MRRHGRAPEPIPLAKLRPPSPHPRLVPRPDLEARIWRAWRSPVTLVSAPAGFGKTSAVVAALRAGEGGERPPFEARDGPVAWVALDERDDDPHRFFRLLGSALRRATGHGAELERALASPQPPPPRTLLTPLLNALDEADPRALVCLDDLHLVRDPRVFEDLTFFVEHAPPGLRLLIVTRADPPLPLHRWRARGQLLELRADDLRLQADEVAALLAAELGRSLAETTVAAVQRATEGWAAGVRLASLALQGAGEPDERALVARLELGEGFALEYLAEEVLARLTAPLAAFLLDTAALDAFAPELVDAVRETGDARERLDEARARGLFVQPATAPPGAPAGHAWWRYHRLFRALLQGRGRVASPGRERDLLRRAADWFEAHDAHEAALEAALAADDGERVARLLDVAAYGLVMDGRATFVERALEGLTHEARARVPRARLAYGWALLLRGRYDDLGSVLVGLAGDAEALSPAHRAQLTALRAVLAGTRARADDALQLARDALAAALDGDTVTRAAAQMALAGAHRELGDGGAAIAAYERALALCRAARLPVPEGLARAHLGLLYVQRGHLRKATSVTVPLAGAAGHPAAAAALASRCSALLEQDEREAVRRALPEVTALAERAGQPAVLANVQLVWSRLHRADGDAALAREALEAALAQAERGVPTWLRALVAVRVADASLADGDVETAQVHLGAAEAFRARGPVEAELVMARGRLHLRRGTPEDLGVTVAAARSLVDAEGDADPGEGVRIAALVLLAQAQVAQGETRPAQATLARAVRRAEREGFVRTFVEAGPACAALLAGVGHPYAARLLAAFAPEDRARAGASETRADVGVPDAGAASVGLTERERDILRALAAAGTYRRVADELSVSVNTVRFHVKNVYAKLGVGTRLEAVDRARQLGWLGER